MSWLNMITRSMSKSNKCPLPPISIRCFFVLFVLFVFGLESGLTASCVFIFYSLYLWEKEKNEEGKQCNGCVTAYSLSPYQSYRLLTSEQLPRCCHVLPYPNTIQSSKTEFQQVWSVLQPQIGIFNSSPFSISQAEDGSSYKRSRFRAQGIPNCCLLVLPSNACGNIES